jgi:hypothetical protein
MSQSKVNPPLETVILGSRCTHRDDRIPSEIAMTKIPMGSYRFDLAKSHVSFQDDGIK